MSLLALAALAVAVAAAAVAAHAWLRFREVLPLERRCREVSVRAEALAALAADLVAYRRSGGAPEELSGLLEAGLDRLALAAGVSHSALWRRGGAAGAQEGEALVARRGSLAAMEPEALGLGDEAWARAFEPASRGAGEADRSAGAEVPDAWRACGLASVRVWGWGTPGKVWGLLAAASPDPSGAELDRQAAALAMVAAHFGSLADRAWEVWEERRAREQLAGGLSVTQRRLDETHLQLMERARRMESLEKITDAIAAHADFVPGGPLPQARAAGAEAGGLGAEAARGADLAAIVAMVAKALEADLCAFLLHDEAARELVTQRGGYGPSGDEGALYRLPLTNEGASSVRVFLSGEPFMTGDAQADPRVITRYAELWKCHSLMVVPLRIGARRLGVLRVGSFERDFFTGDHLRFAQVIAEEAAVLVEGALLSRRLAESNQELERLHRLKDDFISTVSHEFKTPLTSLRGFLSVILDGEAGPLTPDQRRFLGLCKGSAERLGALVQELLDLSRLEDQAVELDPVSLGDLAAEAVERHRWEAERRGVSLALDAGAPAARARGSAVWLARVLDNLLSNALKFTPARGSVTVSVSERAREVECAVADTGVGIPPDERKRLFTKFFRGSDRGGLNPHGSGLGLAICKAALDKHGGRLWVESEPGKGSRFAFAVPALGAGEVEEGAPSRAQGGGSNG